ncbi:MAG: hypothetical protein ACI8SA_001430, partial [Dokdonia sp.]
MRKSVLLLTALFGIASISNAQEETFKPISGMSSLEVTFNPSAIFNASTTGNMFGLSSIGGLNQGIKYRNWMNEKIAYRGTILVGLKNSSMPTVIQNSLGEDVDVKDTYFEWAVQIRPGVERHFAGTKRLSPYVGSELIIGIGSNSYKSERLNATDEVVTDVYKNNPNQGTWTYANGFTAGVGLIAGFDYYIAKDLYLGLEINYAF